ncbi:coiled-coil domain-containing protein 66 isoform X2 [Mastomys coucha]|uniref:coiled-coil domain-containing protein 66 isoform X2 n=1 Tax=Mastomys coucha TaxID=35658 RepID=UPI001261F880|nr:coiled-coil domain-containing protein 66 isoform X2 [Mastomys coucha]XP_031218483.1 coiled-coil domain-containing protein 66 isoform X2 [Mastomys coucha]
MMGNKIKIAKCPLRAKQTGHTLKSTQNTYIGSENLSQKKISTSDTPQAKRENSRLTFSPSMDLYKQYSEKDSVHVQKEISPTTSNIRKVINTTETCSGAKQKPCTKLPTTGNMNSSLVCLTQDQLQQILMLSMNQGNGSESLTESAEKDASQDSLHLINIPSQPKDVNVTGLLQNTEAISPVTSEHEHVHQRAQEAFQQCEPKAAIENEWKPADIFSTLGERERDRSLLEARRAQWKKELDEQVALKKKEKEASHKWGNPWKPSEKVCEELQVPEQPKEAGMLESSCSAIKQEQQRKWIEELNKQVEDDQQRKAEERMMYSKGEEHDRWAMHFDSLKSHPGSQSRLSSQLTHQHLESLCVSPDTQELADVNDVYTSPPSVQVEPSEKKQRARPVLDMAVSHGQKTNFLRSMTALLDPAQIEERERRRQKQLEHQKAIVAQVEENRRKKRLEEEQRKKEEQELELRLAREREEMQRQYEEDILKQKQKEEIVTLKTNELFHTMQRAQELAQRLKQEQRIRELTQKGHDTSRLIQNLGAQVEYKPSAPISSSCDDAEEVGDETTSAVSPKKDTGVQTDDVNLGIFNDVLPHCGPVTEKGIRNFSSPEISAEFSGQIGIRKEKQELSMDKGTNLDKENSWYNGQCNQNKRTEKQTKLIKKCPKKPAWNINKPLKRYVPASAKYPTHLQKEKEEKKVRRQMELLHLVERNNPENLSQNRGTSPEVPASSHRETESDSRLHLIKKVEEPLKTPSVSKERFQTSPGVKSRTQQTQSNVLHLPLKNSDYEKETLTLGDGHTKLSNEMSEPSHFIPYVRTNEIYYLDPDAPLSRPSTQDNQYQKSHDCAREQELFESDHIRDPLLNPKLVKNRDRQQAILKGLSELRQGLLQKQKELETNLIPLTANQEDNFSSSF